MKNGLKCIAGRGGRVVTSFDGTSSLCDDIDCGKAGDGLGQKQDKATSLLGKYLPVISEI